MFDNDFDRYAYAYVKARRTPPSRPRNCLPDTPPSM
jgi:hypothetical protein